MLCHALLPLLLTVLAPSDPCSGVTGPKGSSGEHWAKPDLVLSAGPLRLDVYVSRTAHLFHVVDQLSAWDNACHGQYRDHMELDEVDEDVLARYAAMRAQRRWGQGLEQTFYVPLDVDDAVRAGTKAKHVTRAEADVVVETMEHFAPRVEALLADKREHLLSAFQDVDRDQLEFVAERLARFVGLEELVVPAFPLASPTSGGGAMDGGRLRWEIGSEGVTEWVLIHELTHGFFRPRTELMRAAVERTPGLSLTVLGEGFAYGMGPGLVEADEGDPLARMVGGDLRQGRVWNDDGNIRQRMYGLALRPAFRRALEEGRTLEEFLPLACDVFTGVHELNDTWPGPTLWIAGPANDAVRERFRDTPFAFSIASFSHDQESFERYLPAMRHNDLIVISIAGDTGGYLPERYARLAPVSRKEVEKQLGRRKSIALAGAHEGVPLVFLAAPKAAALAELATSTELFEPYLPR